MHNSLMFGWCMRMFHITSSAMSNVLSAATLLSLSSTLGAVELADLAGDWALSKLDTPSRLRETYYNENTETYRTSANSIESTQPGEILADAFYPDPLHVSTVDFNFAANGSITGGETGTVLGISNNRLTYSDGIELDTVYSNIPGDVLIASSHDIDQQDLALCLKRPDSLVTSDLAGTWNLVSFINPDNISTNVTTRLADTYFVGETSLTKGAVTFDASGNISGLFAGTLAVTGPGSVDAAVIGSGVIPFAVNESKSFLVATLDQGDEQEIIVLARQPGTLTTAELAGSWRFCTIQVPTTLIERFRNVVSGTYRQADSAGLALPDEELVDIFHPDPFKANRFTLQVQTSGSFTGFGTGTMTPNGDQSVNLFIDGENLTFHCNADKTVLIGGLVEQYTHELIVAVRTASAPLEKLQEIVDLKITRTSGVDPMVITWNSASNKTLQGATTLGEWQDIPEADGSDSFVVDPNESAFKFFRIGVSP